MVAGSKTSDGLKHFSPSDGLSRGLGEVFPCPTRLVLWLSSVFSCLPSSAETIPNSGGVYYEYGAGGLEQMTLWIVTLFTYVTDLMFAVAGILVLYNATSIYLKMQTGEGGLIKSMLMLLGSCIFMAVVIIVLPSFFGYHYHSHVVPTVFRFDF